MASTVVRPRIGLSNICPQKNNRRLARGSFHREGEGMETGIALTTPGCHSSNGIRTSGEVLAPMELRARLDRGDSVELLDVREFPEFAAGRIAGSRLIPLGELERRAGEISTDKTVVCICRSGKRSAQAAGKLAALGRNNLSCLDGGLLAWEEAGLPVEKDARAPWSLERQVRFTAGLLVLVGLGLSLIWPAAVGLSWFVGAGLVFAALTDWCGMGLLLSKMPWNKVPSGHAASCCLAASK
jgi:rhodanese-related sulfurtransferase